jgi:hypothetical protein
MGDERSKKFTQFGVKMVAIRGVLGTLPQGEFGIFFFNVRGYFLSLYVDSRKIGKKV